MTQTDAPSPPTANRWFVLILVCAAQFMVVLDSTITNIAIPSIQADLGLAPSSSQWVVTAYTLMFGGFLLLGGRSSDLFGRRRLFLIGLTLFTLASLASGLAMNVGMLILSRGVQGLSAALVSPAALAIITTTFTGQERARALGVWAGIAAGGSAVGLLLGGVLTDALSWPWIFFINVPIGALALGASLRFLPRDGVLASGRLDLPGVVLGTGGLVLLTYGITQASTQGFGDPRTLGCLAGAVVLLVVFLVLESRVPAPIMRLSIFRARPLSVANVVTLLVMGALMSMFFFGSLFLQGIQHYSAILAGVAFLPLAIGVLVGSAISQAIVGRVGLKAVLLVGLVVVLAGLLWISRLQADSSYLVGLLPTLVASAVGMGIVFVPLTLAATGDVAGDDQGLASGIWNTAQQLGAALGLASLAAVASSVAGGVVTAQAQVGGFDVAFMVAAGFIVVAFVVVAAGLRRSDGVSPATAEAGAEPAGAPASDGSEEAADRTMTS